MNEILRTHYPVSRLPEDLRENLPIDGTVEIKIVPDGGPKRPRIKLVDLIGSGPNVHGTEEEVIAHIREGRDDDR